MKNKTKLEQFFVLCLMFIFISFVFCVTGCGGKKSCETVKFGGVDEYHSQVVGVSVPGCGGCFSSGSGWGCDTYGLWAQSIKFIVGTFDENVWNNPQNKSNSKSKAILIALDDQYYEKSGCGGCSGERLKSCYGIGMANSSFFMISLGHSPGSELMIGCGDKGGCIRCNEGNMGRGILTHIEDEADLLK